MCFLGETELNRESILVKSLNERKNSAGVLVGPSSVDIRSVEERDDG